MAKMSFCFQVEVNSSYSTTGCGDWNHGLDYDFPYIWNGIIIPTDEVHHFSESRYTTNQIWRWVKTYDVPCEENEQYEHALVSYFEVSDHDDCAEIIVTAPACPIMFS